MKYINFLKGIIFGFVIGYFIFTLAVVFQLGVKTSGTIWRSELYELKSNLALSIKSPKLVIIGGSSARYGISCKIIQEQTGKSCFNGGTVADMSADYNLNLSRKWLNPGDTALIALEYHYYHNNSTDDANVINYAMGHDIDYLISLDFKRKVQLLNSISLQRVKEGILAKFNPPLVVKKNFQEIHNEYGDIIDNREANMTKKLLKHQETLSPLNGAETWDSINPNNQDLKSIVKFIDWCHKNNIKVLATWPNTTYFDIYKQEKQQIFLRSIRKFYQQNNVPVIGKPEDVMYDKSMFYDSAYHLHDRGMKIRTLQLIKSIQPYLE
ncbi:MAG: hypothetical protein WBF90_15900 [Rivularia sp. (in: cyanobacteria)]|jgi:hypothetical protein